MELGLINVETHHDAVFALVDVLLTDTFGSAAPEATGCDAKQSVLDCRFHVAGFPPSPLKACSFLHFP